MLTGACNNDCSCICALPRGLLGWKTSRLYIFVAVSVCGDREKSRRGESYLVPLISRPVTPPVFPGILSYFIPPSPALLRLQCIPLNLPYFNLYKQNKKKVGFNIDTSDHQDYLMCLLHSPWWQVAMCKTLAAASIDEESFKSRRRRVSMRGMEYLPKTLNVCASISLNGRRLTCP